MIQQPQLVLTRGAGVPSMLVPGSPDYLDDGVIYEMLARSRPYAPAGAGGEAIFTMLYLVTTHYDVSVSLFVTPYVDFAALATQQIDLIGAANPANKSTVHELALSVPYIVGGIERLRVAPRGTWFDVKVETKIAAGNPASARVVIDGGEVETEIVRESKQS